MESSYVVSIKKTEDGYCVWVPGLPGCWSTRRLRLSIILGMRSQG